MKSVAGHQPNLYPYGGFFAKVASVDKFVIVDCVQYVKKEYHNRNRVKFFDSTAKWLSIPVRNAGRYKQSIKDTEIDNSSDWRRIHMRTLELNYGKAPFFYDFFPLVRGLLLSEWVKLSDYNIAFIREAMGYLGIKTSLSIASEIGVGGEAKELIVEICRKTGAGTYLHGIHSLDYIDFHFLESNGINSLVQIFTPIPYPQVKGEFIGNLSILDIIFNCGAEETMRLLKAGSKIFEPDEARNVVKS